MGMCTQWRRQQDISKTQSKGTVPGMRLPDPVFDREASCLKFGRLLQWRLFAWGFALCSDALCAQPDSVLNQRGRLARYSCGGFERDDLSKYYINRIFAKLTVIAEYLMTASVKRTRRLVNIQNVVRNGPQIPTIADLIKLSVRRILKLTRRFMKNFPWRIESPHSFVLEIASRLLPISTIA